MITIADILRLCWPARTFGVIHSDPPVITAMDGGEVPSLIEIEATRADAEQLREQELANDLPARRVAMADAFDALPVPIQSALWATRMAAEAALDRGRIDIARQIIAAQPVPPELEETKAHILSFFPDP